MNIRQSLECVRAPHSFDGPEDLRGYDVFAGYMILDALIANQDRHEQNWAILAPPLLSSPLRLSPSYDHASSLGYNLTDSARKRVLQADGGLPRWTLRGAATRFEHSGKPLSLVEHAAAAVRLCSARGGAWWRHQLASADLTPLCESVENGDIDGMSEVAVTFAVKVLELNLRRLRDGIC